MKELEITDNVGSGKVLLCEKHYRKYLRQISIASENNVAIIISNTKKRGCAQCSRAKVGSSQWAGTMFKIWRAFKNWEKDSQ